jgi:SAM-dependent methyltransferase
MTIVFDRPQIARQRARTLHAPDGHDFLFRWTMDQIADRLDVVQRKFPACVQIGARGPTLAAGTFGIDKIIRTDITAALGPDIVCEDDFFPFANASLDLVVSALSLHTVNDLPGALLQIRRALKPDGLFAAAVLGGETLIELRQCLMEAELELMGGASPRVAPFADKQQMSGLLQRAGFALPVVDSEMVTVTYDNIFKLMADLRHMGEGNAIAGRRKNFTPCALFLRAGELYANRFADPDGRIRATFEIIFLLGWAPHESQQKPLKPGSATTRLATFLNTDEIGTGEKPS